MPKVWRFLSLVGVAVLLLVGIVWFTEILSPKGEDPPAPAAPGIAVPSLLRDGETEFAAYCATCHGLSAEGTKVGPSLLGRIYARNHHSDPSFYQAVERGVRAHHWRFGDMPPIPEATKEKTAQIIAYVRWLQEQAGVR